MTRPGGNETGGAASDGAVEGTEGSLTTRLAGLAAVTAALTTAVLIGESPTLDLVAIGGAATVVAGVVGYLLARRWVVAPLERLTTAMSEVDRGTERELPIRIDTDDEIGRLSAVVHQVAIRLRQISRNLSKPSSLLAHAVEQLTESAIEQNRTVTRQAAALQEAQATVQEIKQTSVMAAEKAQSVLEVAQRAEDVGRAGEKAIEESLTALTAIREQVHGIARRIADLSEKTRQIAHITEAVKDMADQSNMLALNAAIEAVRSGEHGKGFAVVAREIRGLADQSVQATTRVREVLEDIGTAIRNAVTITEEGAAQMESGLTQVRVSGESLRELSGIVKDNSSAVRQIAATVGQQNAGVSQIFQAVNDLNDMMEDTVQRLEITSENVEGLRGVSESVSAVLEALGHSQPQ